MLCGKIHLELVAFTFKMTAAKGFPILIAKPMTSRYIAPIPDSTMSNNTEPEYGFEGEESYVRTPDA